MESTIKSKSKVASKEFTTELGQTLDVSVLSGELLVLTQSLLVQIFC